MHRAQRFASREARHGHQGISNLGAWLCAALLLLGGLSAGVAHAEEGGAAVDRVVERAVETGRVRVIVRVQPVQDFEERYGQYFGRQDQRERMRARIGIAQLDVLGRLPGGSLHDARSYPDLPYLALEVGLDALDELAVDPDVVEVELDVPARRALSTSSPVVGAPDAWAAGATGDGWNVAILDTGVDSSHGFLPGKVVAEACFSTTTSFSSSLCPSGGEVQVGPGAGAACDPAVAGCSHGTHVAGIAAGTGGSFHGVAREGGIIAIQVFSRFDDPADCSPGSAPCALAWSSDQIAALQHVYDLRNDFDIASVNMSLGGGVYSSQATCDANNAGTKAAIDQLRSVGIATVISSGNNGSSSGVSSPGCISTAVAVGATTDSDAIASFSNSSSLLDLLAPGVSVRSSVAGGGYGTWNGTSMAAPHVAGAWAVLKHANPTASVSDVLTLLQNTGVSLTDPRNGVTRPRIRVGAAVANEPPTPAPEAPTLVSPAGTVTTARPTFVWNSVPGGDDYHLFVSDATGTVVDQSFSGASLGCGGGGSCSVESPASLTPGSVTWWVRATNDAGPGVWSEGQGFSYVQEAVGNVTTVSPTGLIATATPDFTWSAEDASTWYQLWVSDPNGTVVNRWYTAAQAGCAGGGTCSVSPGASVAPGQSRWWVRGWNASGAGPWTAAIAFWRDGGAPPAATLVSPSGAGTAATPTFTWNAVASSTWYEVWVDDGSGHRFDEWYTAEDVGCGAGGGNCTLVSPVALAAGSGRWWVRTYNADGNGPWSSGMDFSRAAATPAAATLVAPAGGGTPAVPTFTWNAVADSTWYEVSVNDATGNRFSTWYTAAEVGCDGGGTCTLTSPVGLASGAGVWWVRTYNADGNGPWSDAAHFVVP